MMAQAGACALILAGGAGTRIRHLHPDVPKPLIPVAGRPFLDWVCACWIRQGVRRLAISVGHLADTAARHIATYAWPGVDVITIREERPLGTGGAVRFAADAIPAGPGPLVALNGDSMVFGDLSGAWSLMEVPEVDGVVIGVRMDDAGRYGTLRVGAGGALLGFEEKRPGSGWINAGIYFFRRELLSLFPNREPLSMEYDVFPALIAAGARLRVHCIEADFLDIGTPEELARADAFIRRHAHELEI